MKSIKTENTSDVENYFQLNYPNRTKLLAKLGFRAAEKERVSIIIRALDGEMPESISDLGCGDGELLKKLINRTNHPRRINLIDISQRNIDSALKKISGLTNSVVAEKMDIFNIKDFNPSKASLIIGISDYHKNWKQLLTSGLATCEDILIIDFPKKIALRNILRFIWLKHHKLSFYSTSKPALIKILNEMSLTYHIYDCKYNYVVKIEKGTFHGKKT